MPSAWWRHATSYSSQLVLYSCVLSLHIAVSRSGLSRHRILSRLISLRAWMDHHIPFLCHRNQRAIAVSGLRTSLWVIPVMAKLSPLLLSAHHGEEGCFGLSIDISVFNFQGTYISAFSKKSDIANAEKP